MPWLGLFFIALGGFALSQARLPRHKRKIVPGRGGWRRKGRQPLGRYSCISSGGSFLTAGVFIALTGFHVIEIEPAMLLLGSIPLFLIMIAGVIADDVKKEPSHGRR